MHRFKPTDAWYKNMADKEGESVEAGLWLDTEQENGHRWGFLRNVPSEACAICGVVRRKDKTNKPCIGPVKITPR